MHSTQNQMGDIWFPSTPFYPYFHPIALNWTFILFNNLQVLFCSKRKATKTLWALSDGLQDGGLWKSAYGLHVDLICRWPAVGCEPDCWQTASFHLIGRILTGSLLWSIKNRWKDSLCSPVIRVIPPPAPHKPGICFSKRVDVLYGKRLLGDFPRLNSTEWPF